MKAHPLWIALSLVPALAISAPDKLCEDSLDQDKQPDFSEAGLVSTGGILVTADSPPKLQLDTALQVLNPEKLSLPFEQQIKISYVYESAGANHALGWLYYDDLIARGYIETQGTFDTADDTFRDSDGDGIADFHADLYNLWAPSANRYVGGTPRCGSPKTFTHGGMTYAEPELAIPGCSTNSYDPGATLYDARPGQTGNNISTATVGVNPETIGSTDFSDRGLSPRSPTSSSRGTRSTATRAWARWCSCWPTMTATRPCGETWRRWATAPPRSTACRTTTARPTTPTASRSEGPTRIRGSPPMTGPWISG